ncbi:hypothetical protein N0V86_005759 [Didymella sp. IMI 355093]|nr:hypothetical protein N0V86_005759 [Didymella sp. IMI 355093]
MLSVLKKTSAKSLALTEMTACGLCDKRMTLRALRKHLGHHQEQLALFALPSNLDETEDDPDDEEHGSLLGDVAVSEDEDEEVTDTSEGSEAEEPIHDDHQAFDSPTFAEETSNTNSELDMVNSTAKATSIEDESMRDDMREVFDASKTDSGSRTTMLGTQGNSPADIPSPTVTQPFKEDQSTYADESALQDVGPGEPLLRRPDGSLRDPVETEQEREAQDDAEPMKLERLETSLTAHKVRAARATVDASTRGDEKKLPRLDNLLRLLDDEYDQSQREFAADHGSIAAREHEFTQATGSGAGRGKTIATEAAGSEASAVVTEEQAEFQDREKERKRIIAEAQAKREEAERKAQAADQAAIDAYNKKIAEQEEISARERERIIYESERKESPGAENLRKQREELVLQMQLEKTLQESKDKEEFEAFLRDRTQKQAAEKARQEKEEEELEAAMRKRLAQFGFKDDQIEAMVHKEEETKVDPQPQTDPTPHDPLPIATQPIYAKINKRYLDIETLHYYDIPYEYDADPNYIIVLREMSQKETDILFEHTRRLRSEHGEDGQDRRGRKEYAFVRKKSRGKARSFDGSRSAKDATPGPTVVRRHLEDISSLGSQEHTR